MRLAVARSSTARTAAWAMTTPTRRRPFVRFTLTAQQRDDLVAFLRSLTDEALLREQRFANPWRTRGPRLNPNCRNDVLTVRNMYTNFGQPLPQRRSARSDATDCEWVAGRDLQAAVIR